MITNPLDVTTYLAATKFGYEKGKLFLMFFYDNRPVQFCAISMDE